MVYVVETLPVADEFFLKFCYAWPIAIKFGLVMRDLRILSLRSLLYQGRN